MKTVGERIRQARAERGWSGQELALRCGYKGQSAISNIENRPTSGGGKKLGKIADTLGVSADWLLNGPDADKVQFIGEGRITSSPADLARSVHESELATYDLNESPVVQEAMAIMRRLSPAGQQEALSYLRYMVAHHAPPIRRAGGESDPVSRRRSV